VVVFFNFVLVITGYNVGYELTTVIIDRVADEKRLRLLALKDTSWHLVNLCRIALV